MLDVEVVWIVENGDVVPVGVCLCILVIAVGGFVALGRDGDGVEWHRRLWIWLARGKRCDRGHVGG